MVKRWQTSSNSVKNSQVLSRLVKRCQTWSSMVEKKLSNVVKRRQMCSRGAKRGLRLLAMVV